MLISQNSGADGEDGAAAGGMMMLCPCGNNGITTPMMFASLGVGRIGGVAIVVYRWRKMLIRYYSWLILFPCL